MTLTAEQWTGLADLRAEEREARMLEHYEDLASHSEEERQNEMLAATEAVYDLPHDKLRAFTVSRLKVWLDLEPGTANTVAGSYNEMAEAPLKESHASGGAGTDPGP